MHVDLRELIRVVPAEELYERLCAAGKQSQRVRRLPEILVMWLVIGMGLYRDVSIRSALDRVADAVGLRRWGPAERPCATAITDALDRLGWETVREVFRWLAELFMARHGAADMRWGLQVVTLDSSTGRTADSPENSREFGRPGSNRGGRAAFPQIRILMLVGAFTHLVAHVAMGPYSWNEQRLAAEMVRLGWIRPGMLLLLDRAFYSFVWPARFLEQGAHFVVRAQVGRNAIKPTQLRRLGKNDWLCELRNNGRPNQRGLPELIQLRVVTRTRRGFRPVTILTNLLDPQAYPAAELFALYKDRWEAELTYRELKVELAGSKVPFRCKTPDRVRLEAYGLFLAYNCVRALMAEAAERAEVAPTRISFTGALDCVRRAIERLTPDVGWAALHERLVLEVSMRRLPKRRTRSCPRAVKSLFVRYARKKPNGKSTRSRYQTQRARQEQRRQGQALVA